MSDLINKAEKYASNLLTNNLDSKYVYHNLKHTKRVVKSAKELIAASELEEARKEHLLIAAWFHDTGFIYGPNDHEESSCKIARQFLLDNGYSLEGIKKVEQIISATKQGFEPQTLSEKIIRDADCSHFGKKSYLETTKYLREELSLLGVAKNSSKKWRDLNIEMLENEHVFYTDYAKENWQKAKNQNIKILLKEKKNEKTIAKKEQLKAKYKNENPDRGIQTLFRVTLKNHIILSNIADTKANILLSVNAIIISVALANLIPKLDNPSNAYLIYPATIFVFFSVVSMVMAILATRPNITSGKFTKKDVEDKKVNLLFFGNFHKMSLVEYEWAIQELVKDKNYIYSSLTKDLYFLGLVLNRKYKILRWTYTVFMVGIIISVLAFGLSFHFNDSIK